MTTDLSQLSDHILVLGVPASQDGLLSLLAVLRSKCLLQWRPIVIVDANTPGGGSWEAVAQFSDVHFINVSQRAAAVCAVCCVFSLPNHFSFPLIGLRGLLGVRLFCASTLLWPVAGGLLWV
jgi:hypothetical protein